MSSRMQNVERRIFWTMAGDHVVRWLAQVTIMVNRDSTIFWTVSMQPQSIMNSLTCDTSKPWDSAIHTYFLQFVPVVHWLSILSLFCASIGISKHTQQTEHTHTHHGESFPVSHDSITLVLEGHQGFFNFMMPLQLLWPRSQGLGCLSSRMP